jgi:hypothetical protein
MELGSYLSCLAVGSAGSTKGRNSLYEVELSPTYLCSLWAPAAEQAHQESNSSYALNSLNTFACPVFP